MELRNKRVQSANGY